MIKSLSKREEIIIKACARLLPGKVQELRTLLKSDGFTHGYNEVNMICYGLINTGHLKYANKNRAFEPTRQGLIAVTLPVDQEKASIDNLRRLMHRIDSVDREPSRIERTMAPIISLTKKKGNKIMGADVIVADIICLLSERQSVKALFMRRKL